MVDRERTVILARVDDFVVRVRDGKAEPEQVTELLQSTLRDPDLQLLLRLPGAREQEYVDVYGHEARPHGPTRYSVALVATGGFGYLLKDRVLRVDDFLDALERVAAGGSALDPEVVRGLLAPTRLDDPISELTQREREALALVAEGRSNASIAESLVVAERTVETHAQHLSEATNP